MYEKGSETHFKDIVKIIFKKKNIVLILGFTTDM